MAARLLPPAPAPASLSDLDRAFLVGAVSAGALLLHHHQHGPKPPRPSSSSPAFALSDELFVEPPQATGGSEEAAVGVGSGGDTCATVEMMGEEAAGRGYPEAAGLRVRELIRRHFLLHGDFMLLESTFLIPTIRLLLEKLSIYGGKIDAPEHMVEI